MTLSPNKQTMRRFLDAVVNRDIDTMRPLVHEDIKWWMCPSLETFERPVTGKETILELQSGSKLSAFKRGSTRWDIKHMVEEDNLLAMHMDRHATLADGRPYRCEYHWLVRFEGGQIIEVWGIIDSASAAKQSA